MVLSHTVENETIEPPVQFRRQRKGERGPGVGRIVCFFGIIVALAFLTDAMIGSGLRRIKTSTLGAENEMMQGKVNAQVLITGSSRATAHYDPRIIRQVTGRSAFNLGRNGSQTDIQLIVLKAYLEHNRKPAIVLHNLDAFSFVTTREIYDFAEYVPYLHDNEMYRGLVKIDPNMRKSRYIPLYGYVVEDMKFSWIAGVKGFFGWSPPEDFYSGFNPRSKKWTDEFTNFKKSNPDGVKFDIEPAGVRDLENLILTCKQNGIQLILVYSPEYSEMEALTTNRPEIFAKFYQLASRYNVPVWDYSNWRYASDRDFFQNSQHLNDKGAAVFSSDVANRLENYIGQDHALKSISATAENGTN